MTMTTAARTHRLGIGADEGQRRDDLGNGVGKRRATEGAAEHADQRDADLLGGEETSGFRMKGQRGLIARRIPVIALAGGQKRLKPLTARGNNRHFRERKIPVQKDHHEQNDYVR